MNEKNAIIINSTDDDLEEKPATLMPPPTLQTSNSAPPKSTKSHTGLDRYRNETTRTRKVRATVQVVQRSVTLSPSAIQHAATRLSPAVWPHHVVSLRANFNPDAISLPFVQHSGPCGCPSPCRSETCRNAKLGIFCLPNCCAYKGRCRNSLAESKSVAIAQDTSSKAYAVAATAAIPKGVVIGEYLGRLTLERPRKDRIRNRGYRLLMRQAPKHCGKWRACIDAEMFGGLMRFVNHSCQPSCAFFELSNGSRHTVVVTTKRDITAGEEVTVDYGNDLWFVCRCKRDSCRHKDMQQLKDP